MEKNDQEQEKEARNNAPDEFAIHVMPEKFRSKHLKNSKAQITGLIIISVGFIVLAILSFLAYIILFKKTAPKETLPDQQTENTIQSLETEKNENDISEKNAERLNKAVEDNNNANNTQPREKQAETAAATTTNETADNEKSEENFFPAAAADADKDGLSYNEENLLGTSDSAFDSDSDGYEDLSEVMSLYNPAGPEKLSLSPRIKTYFNKTYQYGILLPYGWVQLNMDSDNSVIFKSGDGHFFQIIALSNAGRQPVEIWHQEQMGGKESEIAAVFSYSGLKGVKSEDGLTYYLSDNKLENIFTITYNPGLSKNLEYKNLFEAAVRSFELK